MKSQHKQNHEEQSKEMRTRLKCDKCDYRTTSKAVLKQHIQLNHEQKVIKSSKRKTCNVCNKQFNKETTFIKHMENLHRVNMGMEGQNQNQNLIQN